MKTMVEYFLSIVIVWAFFSFALYYLFTHVEYVENTETMRSSFPRGTTNVSYFGTHSWRIYECKMPEGIFWQDAKRHEWKMSPIQRPIKMIRYKYYKTTEEEFKRQIENLTPETETKDSCFHFVKKGYYYLNEKTPGFCHVAYDSETNFLYVYASSERGRKFYMSELDTSYDDDTSK